MTAPKSTQSAWIKVNGPTLDPKKKYAVRVTDDNEWDDDWIIIAHNKKYKRWEILCGCESNEGEILLNYITHYLELPE